MNPSKLRFHPSGVTSRGSLTATGHWTVLSLSILVLAAASQAGATGWDAQSRPSRSDVPGPKLLNMVKETATDPEHDTFGSGPTQIDITEFSAEATGGNLVIGLTFAGAVSPPDSGEPNAIDGFIDIDADQDVATGDVPWTDFLTGSNATGMGNEFYVDLFSYSAADGAADVVDDLTETVTGRAPVSFTASSMTVLIPLTLLGGDDGAVNTAAVIGTAEEPTDKVPNAGFLSSDAGEPPPADTVTLQGDRFAVTIDTKDYEEVERPARLVTQSDDSAVLWFFDPNNWEVLIKVLDGCGVNNRYWVLFAATTDVELTLTVTDTQTNMVKQYTNELGNPADAVVDTDAFATCP